MELHRVIYNMKLFKALTPHLYKERNTVTALKNSSITGLVCIW